MLKKLLSITLCCAILSSLCLPAVAVGEQFQSTEIYAEDTVGNEVNPLVLDNDTAREIDNLFGTDLRQDMVEKPVTCTKTSDAGDEYYNYSVTTDNYDASIEVDSDSKITGITSFIEDHAQRTHQLTDEAIQAVCMEKMSDVKKLFDLQGNYQPVTMDDLDDDYLTETFAKELENGIYNDLQSVMLVLTKTR